MRDQVRNELQDNLLPFWRLRVRDDVRGGFVGELGFDGQVVAGAAKGLIFTARMLWTFAAVYRELGEPGDRALADRAFQYLQDHFLDTEQGGYCWEVDADGRPTDWLKRTYGQAFCVYALSEYDRACDVPAARETAVALFDLLDLHARDPQWGGYFEVCHRDWTVAGDARLSPKDQASPKSMNTHLHVLEALTNLVHVVREPRVVQRMRALLALFDQYILDKQARHQHHFFARDWTVASSSYTFGHDIEAAWLLGEAAETLADSHWRQRADQWAVSLATAVLEEGVDQDGGLLYEGRGGQVIDRSKQWWPQAEAVVGFLHAHSVSGDERFRGAAQQVWQFIRRRLVDVQHGEWHWAIAADGEPDRTQPKVSAWKGPYHNVRMCLETLHRLQSTVDDR